MKNIGTRFLLPFGLIAILFSLFVFYRAYAASRRHANELVSQQAALALEFNLAIRNYAANKIRPAIERLSGKDNFDTETMSTSFISRTIFEEVRRQFPEYVIRFASDQPRNPINQANADELRMIEYFRQNPQVAHRTDEIQIDGRRYLAHFTPKWMKAECMRCHGNPNDAPAGLVKKYGATASFHRTLGDVAGLDTVAVPVDSIQAGLVFEMHRQSLILAAGLLLLFGSVMLVFRSVVTQRLAVMARHFHEIAAHPESSSLTQVEVGGKDEIGVVAAAFNRLVEQLRVAQALLEERVVQRTAELAQANEELRREIGERQRAEVALRQSTDELDRFFSVNLDLLCVADTDGYFRRLNPVWERILGHTREELQARRFLDFIHPDDLASTQEAVSSLASQREVIDFVNRYRCRDGTYRWLEWRSAPAGSLIYAAARDITERKQTEDALKASESFLEAIIERSPTSMWVSDHQGTLIRMNQACRDLLHVTDAELIGKYNVLEDNIVEEQGAMPLVKQVFEQGKRVQFTLRYDSARLRQLKLGETTQVVLEVTMSPVLDAQRRIVHAIVQHLDVSERERAQAALRESEERLRLALAATKQGLYDLNLQTGEAVVSPEYLRMIGYEPEEIAPTADWWREQLHPEDREASFRTLQECVRAERGEYRLEYRLRTKTGGWRWLLSLGKVVKRDPQGRPLRMLGTHTDITDRKQAEEARLELERQLLHAQKLESLGVLAGGVAHDFNNLLAAMLGNLELALLDLSPVSSVRPSLDEAVRVAKRAADLTRQMLAYSGKGQFIVTSLNLSELVSENAYMLRAAIAKTVTLNLQLKESLPLIRADAGQVQQVVMNLITNASEAIGDKPGIVVLSTGVQECGQDVLDRSRLEEKAPPGQYVYLEVTDTGCGMDRRTQQRLFDPFFTTKFTGRGLGMSAVLGILRGHHGAITVESEPGKGTTIRVLFPAPASAVAPAQLAGDVRTQMTSRQDRVLLNGLVILADDEEAVRKVAQKALERMGFQCLPAADGQEAIDLFQHHQDKVVCVLLDLTMPKKDGLATFIELRQLKPNVKAILCSGYNEQDATRRFIGQGLAGFIQKPYDLDRLRSELEKVLPESV